jgi:hypothetical protein
VDTGRETDDCAACHGNGWPDGKDESQERLASWVSVNEPDPRDAELTRLRASLAAAEGERDRLREAMVPIVHRLRNILGPRPGDDQLDAAEAVLAKIQETPDAG